ncbi:DUF6230 family protein [Streptomyces sp. SCA3-4]|uniref:DUF6230 family protein n=1 Tax=Streptomyces sichuanensis TaxID=2871810 RepID=UPI001CE2FBBD|nr:DUF6230 family protein [Streptomyces sichuanensis]MCA6096699.1 DUF6230 family protein [Streptomyces sichuanensis]
MAARRRWGRFWLLLTPAVLAAGALLAATASGALATSVAASGSAFKVSAERVVADGVRAVPAVYTEPGEAGARHPVLRATVRRARIEGLCVSLVVPTPLGKVTLRAVAGRSDPVVGTELSVDAGSVRGKVDFAGVLAAAGGVGEGGTGGFLAVTDHVVVRDGKVTGWQGAGASLRMSDPDVALLMGEHECY